MCERGRKYIGSTHIETTRDGIDFWGCNHLDRQQRSPRGNKIFTGMEERAQSRQIVVVVVLGPLFLLIDDLWGSPIEVELPQGFLCDPWLLLAHPFTSGTHCSPEDLEISLGQLFHFLPTGIRFVDVNLLRR